MASRETHSVSLKRQSDTAPLELLLQVVLLCLSSKLDFFPLPVWAADEDPVRPGSRSWLWSMGTGRWHRGGRGRRRQGAGFRVEEAGDDFYLISYPAPEGWRCAVEIHRFLVGVQTLSSVPCKICCLERANSTCAPCRALPV